MLRGCRSSTEATVSITGTVPSMPSLTARISKSSNTASAEARRSCCGGRWMAVTPRVFCAVSAAIALRPWHPRAMKVFRSAWMPAPPPESDPAMVRTTGRLCIVLSCPWAGEAGRAGGARKSVATGRPRSCEEDMLGSGQYGVNRRGGRVRRLPVCAPAGGLPSALLRSVAAIAQRWAAVGRRRRQRRVAYLPQGAGRCSPGHASQDLTSLAPPHSVACTPQALEPLRIS